MWKVRSAAGRWAQQFGNDILREFFRVSVLRIPHRVAGRPILLACMPKSGSTFLASALAKAFGYVRDGLRCSNEVQEFDRLKLLGAENAGVVSQSHMFATDFAVDQINKHRMQVVVLERSIADAIVSFRDHICARRDRFERFVSSSLFLDDWFFDLPRSRQYDYLIETLAPWYVRFHMSWQWKKSLLSEPPYFETYESLFDDPVKRLNSMLDYFSLTLSRDNIDEIIKAAGKPRFNIGKVGRSRSILSWDQFSRLREIVGTYGADQPTLAGPDAILI